MPAEPARCSGAPGSCSSWPRRHPELPSRAPCRSSGRIPRKGKETNHGGNQEAEDPSAASQRPTGGDKAMMGKKQYFRRKKMCRFCVDKIDDINYKDVRLLQLLHLRARQDHAAAHFGRLRSASAAAGGSHQAGAQHRADAVRDVDCKEGTDHGSHSKRRNRKAGPPRRRGEGRRRLRAQFPAAAPAGGGGNGSNKKIVEQERQAYLRREAKDRPTRRIWPR